MHTGSGQYRARIGLAEGEQSRLAELFEGRVPETEDGGELYLCVAQRERRVAVGRPERLTEGDRLVEALLARVRILTELNQPCPVDCGNRPGHMVGRLLRVRYLTVVSNERLPQGRRGDTTGAHGVDILQSTGNVVPTAHIVSIGCRVQVPAPRKRGSIAPGPQPPTAGGYGRWGEDTHVLRVSACDAGRDPQMMSVISPDQ